jgi:hypothetical protein
MLCGQRFLQGVPLVFKENHGFDTSQTGMVFIGKSKYISQQAYHIFD